MAGGELHNFNIKFTQLWNAGYEHYQPAANARRSASTNSQSLSSATSTMTVLPALGAVNDVLRIVQQLKTPLTLPKPMLPKLLTTRNQSKLLWTLLIRLMMPLSRSPLADWQMTFQKKKSKMKHSIGKLSANASDSKPFKKPLPPGNWLVRRKGLETALMQISLTQPKM